MRLEPLRLDHVEELARAAADGRLWAPVYSSVPAPGDEGVYIEKALAMKKAGTGHPFVVVDQVRGLIIGSTRFYHYEPENRHVLLGYTWYAQSSQGTKTNPACKQLMLAYAFEVLQCAAVEFQVDAINHRSRAAVQKLGARQDGILRNHKIRKDGTLRDTVSFSITDHEWPAVKANLEKRLMENVADAHRA